MLQRRFRNLKHKIPNVPSNKEDVNYLRNVYIPYSQMYSCMHTFFSRNIFSEKLVWSFKNIKTPEQANLQFYKYYCSSVCLHCVLSWCPHQRLWLILVKNKHNEANWQVQRWVQYNVMRAYRAHCLLLIPPPFLSFPILTALYFSTMQSRCVRLRITSSLAPTLGLV